MKADAVSLSTLSDTRPVAGALPASESPDRVGRVLTRAQAGDRAAFRELICTYQARIYSLALRMLGVREDAQELAQDVFVILHRHLPKIVSVAHLGAWLRKAVCHRAIDRLRSRPRHIALPLDAADEQEAPRQDGDPILEGHLRQLIASLPPIPRSVVLLRYQEDLDPSEIAEALGVPLNTVKSHLRRSLALIRARCAPWRGDKRQ
ncbi:MAG TPA: RNA polymerase sigma factor [Steroidobacteraceae bacterium]|jgi:RNA polymerase sigma-70 factor (ECF subfamily)|nr:RNA polymerase sigma factor [Steroidobacteraceae bacterium]